MGGWPRYASFFHCCPLSDQGTPFPSPSSSGRSRRASFSASSRAGEDPSSRARLSWSRLCFAGPRTKGEFADFSSESPPIESGTFKGGRFSVQEGRRRMSQNECAPVRSGVPVVLHGRYVPYFVEGFLDVLLFQLVASASRNGCARRSNFRGDSPSRRFLPPLAFGTSGRRAGGRFWPGEGRRGVGDGGQIAQICR